MNIKGYGDITYPENHHASFLNLIEAVKGPPEAKIANAKNISKNYNRCFLRQAVICITAEKVIYDQKSLVHYICKKNLKKTFLMTFKTFFLSG